MSSLSKTGAKRVIMLTSISGARGDAMWPPAGQPLVCGIDEANQLIRAGVAMEAPDQTAPEPPKPEAQWPPKEERAVVPVEAEVRGSGASEAAGPPETPPPAAESPLEKVAPRRGPGRPRKDSLPK